MKKDRKASPGDEAKGTDGERKRGLTILVVDDTVANVGVIQALLSNEHEVVACFRPKLAAEMAAKVSFDAVIVDLSMAEMDGFAVAKAIRALETGKSVPILLVSAVDHSPKPERMRESGIDAFLPLPLELGELLPNLQRLIRDKMATQAG